MTMGAGLIALAADVNLERAEVSPSKDQAVFRQFGFKPIHVSPREALVIDWLFPSPGTQHRKSRFSIGP